MGYSANRKKELGINTTLSYSQRRKQEIAQESLAKQKGTTAYGMEQYKYARGLNLYKEQKSKELNSKI